jgi:NADPH:quinone reductase-like Zn-dependent oxidoreductase
VTGIIVEPDRADLEAIATLASEGKLAVRVARRFPLEDAPKAHQLGERGQAGGKMVLTGELTGDRSASRPPRPP